MPQYTGTQGLDVAKIAKILCTVLFRVYKCLWVHSFLWFANCLCKFFSNQDLHMKIYLMHMICRYIISLSMVEKCLMLLLNMLENVYLCIHVLHQDDNQGFCIIAGLIALAYLTKISCLYHAGLKLTGLKKLLAIGWYGYFHSHTYCSNKGKGSTSLKQFLLIPVWWKYCFIVIEIYNKTYLLM